MGAECNPGKYRLANKMAKVYRKMFSKQKDNLAFQVREDEKLPRYLAGKSYIDVTADYVDVSDVAISFSPELPDTVKIAYLCVFNSGEWKAINWGRVENNIALFKDMGMDIAYLPALYVNKEVVPNSPPFILREDGTIRELIANHGNTSTVELISTTRRKQEVSTDGVEKAFFKAEKEYELSYWDNGWQSLGKQTAGEGTLVFDNVPAGGLYWLVEEDSDKEERIFTIENGKQVWW